MKCPKCGRQAYGGHVVKMKRRVTERQDDGTYVKVYEYRDYLHYEGSKKSITLKALSEVLQEVHDIDGGMSRAEQYQTIETKAKNRAGSEVVHHYGPV